MSDDKVRLFVAAQVPQNILQELSVFIEPFKPAFPKARWAPVANQHITLKFVGWFPRSELGRAEDAIATAVEGCRTGDISVVGLGAFPSQRRIRVLWAGLEDPGGVMAPLAKRLDEVFEPLGVTPENRDFSPHLTLARFRTPAPHREPLPELTLGNPTFRLEGVELFSSHLSPRGARYEILRSFHLDG
ncbi:MAG: RNA 2',3'-cyclic phosphodiesterase [Actinomycetota bacterium]